MQNSGKLNFKFDNRLYNAAKVIETRPSFIAETLWELRSTKLKLSLLVGALCFKTLCLMSWRAKSHRELRYRDIRLRYAANTTTKCLHDSLWFCSSPPVCSLVAACWTRILERGDGFSSSSLVHVRFLSDTCVTLCRSACRTWFRHSKAFRLPSGSGELEWCSSLLPVEGQETSHRRGVGVGCTWGTTRYIVHTLML